MPNFNKNSFGQFIRVNFNQNIVSNTKLEMKLEPQTRGDIKNLVPVLGVVDVNVDDEKFKANEYVEFKTLEDTFKQDGSDGDAVGRWRVKAIATLTTQTISTDYTFFRVLP